MDGGRKEASKASRDLPVQIIKFSDDPSHWDSVEKMFFDTATQRQFSSSADRNAFSARWLGRYLRFDRDNILLAVAEDGEVQGYLTGCLDSRTAGDLYREFDFFKIFDPFFDSYPAHLHVNVCSGRRNRGIGANLIEAYIDHCRRKSVSGVYVVTARQARNVRFYLRHGFGLVATTRWNERDLVLLGRKIDCDGT